MATGAGRSTMRRVAAGWLGALLFLGFTAAPSSAQSIVDTLREVLGPPVDERPAPRASGAAQPPAAAAPRLDPSVDGPATPVTEIPVPEERPGDSPGETVAPVPGVDAPTEVPTPPLPSEVEVPPLPSEADVPTPSEPPVQTPPADSADVPADTDETPATTETAPTPSEDDAAETDGEAAAPPPGPPPAYVPPAEARTEPEPDAPTAPASEVTPAASVEAAAAIEDARTCEAELKRRGAEFEVGPSISDGDCGVLRPVSLTRLSSGASVSPQTQFLCHTALAFDIWVSDGVVPAAAEILDGATVEAIRHASTYTCRSRASESRISEHSRGSAIDIAGIDLSGGRTVEIMRQEPGSAQDRFLADIRRAACGPFMTVLGPGTDADHDTHFHLDIAARTNGSTYCR